VRSCAVPTLPPLCAVKQIAHCSAVLAQHLQRQSKCQISMPKSDEERTLNEQTTALFAVAVHMASALTKRCLTWSCDHCDRECVPIRTESRCLCGHRLKDHCSVTETPPKYGSAVASSACKPRLTSLCCMNQQWSVVFHHGQSAIVRRCKAAGCKCKGFFFIVAEGAWVLRCRCKHKHTDHNAATHACSKAGCTCSQFDSPWVCNCNHPWAQHTQAIVDKQVHYTTM